MQTSRGSDPFWVNTVWTVKHKPKSLSEIVGNADAIKTFYDWLTSWEKHAPKKRAVLLYGPPGTGKTSTAEASGVELIEQNASNYRTENAVNSFAGLASQYETLFKTEKMILLDELDGLTGNADRGGIKAIIRIVKISKHPIVLIVNNAYEPRFAALRSCCLLIEYKQLSVTEVMKRLQQICNRENVQVDDNALKFITQRSGGDLRSAINDLQAMSQGKQHVTYDDVAGLSYRDRHDNIFNVLRMIFYGKTCSAAKQAVNMADVDTDMLLEWIYENVPAHFTDAHDLANAMDALSMADVYRGRIRRTQNWSFLRYVIDYMSAGVTTARQNSKSQGWIPFKFPSRIQALSRTRMERQLQKSICTKLKSKLHISADRSIKEVLPYLKIMFKNPDVAAGLSKRLDLNAEMTQYLTA